MVLMATDLPEPVVPAISRCGMRARSTITGSPPMVLPRQSGSLAVRVGVVVGREQFAEIDLLALRRSAVRCRWRCGPTRRRRARRRALIERAMSSARPITRDDLMPGAGSSSYSVTTGPGRALMISPRTPKSPQHAFERRGGSPRSIPGSARTGRSACGAASRVERRKLVAAAGALRRGLRARLARDRRGFRLPRRPRPRLPRRRPGPPAPRMRGSSRSRCDATGVGALRRMALRRVPRAARHEANEARLDAQQRRGRASRARSTCAPRRRLRDPRPRAPSARRAWRPPDRGSRSRWRSRSRPARSAPSTAPASEQLEAGQRPEQRVRAGAACASPMTPPRPVGSGQRSLVRQAGGEARGEHRAAEPERQPQPFAIERPVRGEAPAPDRDRQHAARSTARPNNCISRSAPIAPGVPSRLRTGASVAWLSDGSCTDQVASATRRAARQRDQRERRRVRADAAAQIVAQVVRRAKATRVEAAVRSQAMRFRPAYPSTATRRCSASAVVSLVLHHGDADVARAGIAAVGAVAREIAARA